jgi:hypothetical protein
LILGWMERVFSCCRPWRQRRRTQTSLRFVCAPQLGREVSCDPGGIL